MPPLGHISQVHFQVYKDLDGVNVSLPLAGVDLAAPVPLGSRARVRLAMQEDSGEGSSQRYVLQFRVNGGQWAAVDDSAPTPVLIAAASGATDGDATSQRLDSTAFTAGELVASNRSTGTVSIVSSGPPMQSELEWCLLLPLAGGIVVGDIIQFRAVAVSAAWTGGDLTPILIPLTIVYSVYATINVTAAQSGGGAKMPERATVYETGQWGAETTPGVAVAATKRLLCTEFEADNQPNIKPYRQMGIKFPTAFSRGKEHTAARITGDQAFNDMIYLLNSLLIKTTPSTPANNASWTVGVGAASAGTFTLTFNGQTTSAIAFGATAAAVQAALGLLSTVGPNNVAVAGASPTWVVTFVGALSTTTLALTGLGTGLTGGAFTSVLVAAATNARRYTFFPSFNQPDVVQTYTLEKGVSGTASLAMQIAYFCVSHLDFRFTKDEASINGDGFGRTATDPFTMTTGGMADVVPVPVDPMKVSVWAGAALVGAAGVARLTRCLEFEANINNRLRPAFTLDDSVPSFSAAVESAAEWAFRMALEHDSNGIAMLANMRAGTEQFVIVEAVSDTLIEAGFPYRLKVTFPCNIMTSPRQSIEDVEAKVYNGQMRYDTAFGGGVKVEVDSAVTAL